jgi:hypothetical protein
VQTWLDAAAEIKYYLTIAAGSSSCRSRADHRSTLPRHDRYMRLDTIVAFGLIYAASCSDHPSASAPDPAPPDVVKSALANDEFQWDSVSARDYTLYVPRDSYAATRVADFGAAAQEAIARDLSTLADTRLPGHLRVFYVSSRAEMKTVAGGAYSGYSDAAALGVVLVAANGWRPAHRHEIMHVLSLRAWGYPGTNGWADPGPTLAIWRQGSWLHEGLAAAAEQLCGAYTYRGFAAQMQTEGQLFPLDTRATHSTARMTSRRMCRPARSYSICCSVLVSHDSVSCGEMPAAMSNGSMVRAQRRSSRTGTLGYA